MADPVEGNKGPVPPEIDVPVSLRVIADRLEKTPQSLRTPKYDLLLGYLQSGVLISHVRLQGLLSSPLAVPVEYWHGVRSNQMRWCLVRHRSKKQFGRFQITVKKIGAALVSAVLPELDKAGDLTEKLQRERILLRLMEFGDMSVEAVVMESEWKVFLNKVGIEENASTEKTGKGRPAYEHVELVYLEIAALLYRQIRQDNQPPSFESISESVVEVMRKRPNSPPPPKASTISSQFVAKVRRYSDEYEPNRQPNK